MVSFWCLTSGIFSQVKTLKLHYRAVQKLPPENGHIMISGRFIDQIKLEVISSFLYNYGIHASLVF